MLLGERITNEWSSNKYTQQRTHGVDLSNLIDMVYDMPATNCPYCAATG